MVALRGHPAWARQAQSLLKCVLAVAGACGVGLALAQYKLVGPDGRVTYTDRPPVGSAAQSVSERPRQGSAAAGAQALAALPYELRQTATRYPVQLYTGPACSPCDQARSALRQRGIPYTELTVTSADDQTEFRQQGLGSELPVLTVGTQRLIGWQEREWQLTLDAAAYPSSSQLPAAYVAPAPRPLTVSAAPSLALPARPVRRSPPEVAPAPPPAPASGPRIRF